MRFGELQVGPVTVIGRSGLFDSGFYLEQAGLPAETAPAALIRHYLRHGSAAGLRPHLLFDPAFYLERHPEVRAAGLEPLRHYLEYGWRLGWSPHPLFDPAFYLKLHPEVSAAGLEPLRHYLEHGWRLGWSPHPLFDPAFYLERYPEVSAAGLEPLRHYQLHGAGQGRWPNRLFDGAFYLRCHPEVAARGGNPLVDWLEHGCRRGDRPHPLFDPVYYRRAYPESAPDPLAYHLQSQVCGTDRDTFEIPAPLRSLKPLLLVENLGGMEPSLTGNPFHDFFADMAGLDHPDTSPAADWYDAVRPEISVVIINYKAPTLTRLCLETLWANTSGRRYEAVVLDNGSCPEDVAELEAFPGRYRLVRTPVNRFFGEGNNLAIEAARGRYIMFLNNDALVTPGWLEPLMAMLDDNAGVAAVGPQLLYLSGRLQEAGAVIDETGTPVRLGWGGRSNDPAFAVARPVDYVSAAALLCRRSVLEQIGGFDWCWDPLYFEDADLCLRLRLNGGQVLYCPDSRVYHIENASTRHLEIDRMIALNRLKFLDRWHPGAESPMVDSPSADRPLITTGTRPAGRPVLAIQAGFPWLPGQAMRWVLHIAAAAQEVFEVYLLTPQPWSRLRLLRLGAALGVPVGDIRVIVTGTGSAMPPIDVFVAFGTASPPPLAAGRRNLLIWTRTGDGNAVVPAAPGWLDGYQAVLVPSEALARRLSAAVSLPVIVLTPPPDYGSAFTVDKERLILSVGGFGDGCRSVALIERLETGLAAGILPVGTTLALAGVVASSPESLASFERVRLRSEDQPVQLFPNASRRRLANLYQRAAVFWPAADDDAGRGFALTALEALSAGVLPVAMAGSATAEDLASLRTGLIVEHADEQLALSGRCLAEIATPAGQARCYAAARQVGTLSSAGFLEGLRAVLLQRVFGGDT